MVIALMSALPARAVRPSDGEIFTARQWAETTLFPGEMPTAPPCWIEVRANNDPVQANARNGRPMRLGGKDYLDGLFCHAVSDLVVHLDAPAEAFEALVGVDSNNHSAGGRGSVVFRVVADGEAVWESPVLREGMVPVAASAALRGARSFSLQVADGGDGIACDQADWALARIRMADGSVLRLGDLPIVDAQLPATPEGLPFSFRYGGKPFGEAAQWERTDSSELLDSGVIEQTIRLLDAATGLAVRCVGRSYPDYPVVEWTLWLENTGTTDTPLIEDLHALDTTFRRYAWPGNEAEFDLHHFVGSPCAPQDFQPLLSRLGPGSDLTLSGAGGRPTNSTWCYMNLEWPSQGVIVGIGWPGQWAARFARDDATGLRLRIGQETTRFVLRPGEQVRSPLVALLFWRGDWTRAQNVWRAWMRDHNVPRRDGKVPTSQLNACSSHQYGEMIHADEASQILFIDRYLEEGLKLDYWWMDAGWYPNEGGWGNTGTWEVDRERFPRGLRAITDHGRERGVKSIVWFEPERVTPKTWLYDTHPEWLLGNDGEQKLLNLGNPEARTWLTEHVDGLLESEGIDLYRQDFNIDPLAYWRSGDTEADRQGITENHYVTGYLAYWDELRRRHPGMIIDSCASGGRRNDLETMRRAVPLLRSDYIFEPTGNQGLTYGLSYWLPFYGTGANLAEVYNFRSSMCPGFTGCLDMRRTDLDYETARHNIAVWRQVAPDMVEGDYYPLTDYSLDTDVWIGWQFNNAEAGTGFVQVFRRERCIYQAARLPLRGLEAEARYRVTDLDTGVSEEATGEELTAQGALVTIDQCPGTVLLRYERL